MVLGEHNNQQVFSLCNSIGHYNYSLQKGDVNNLEKNAIWTFFLGHSGQRNFCLCTTAVIILKKSVSKITHYSNVSVMHKHQSQCNGRRLKTIIKGKVQKEVKLQLFYQNIHIY